MTTERKDVVETKMNTLTVPSREEAEVFKTYLTYFGICPFCDQESALAFWDVSSMSYPHGTSLLDKHNICWDAYKVCDHFTDAYRAGYSDEIVFAYSIREADLDIYPHGGRGLIFIP